MKIRVLSGLLLLFVGCSSKPVIMSQSDVKVSREEPSSKCQSLGLISGRTLTVKGTVEEAVEDLKREATLKGANYVKMQGVGANTKSVTGVAYDCP